MLAMHTKNQKNTYTSNSLSSFDNLQHYSNYLICHSD